MAYLHCHNCDWQQDDFWDKNYNPIRFLLNWEKDLLNDLSNLDSSFTTDIQFIKDNGNITRRELIARELESHARTIRKMKFRTYEEYQRLNPDRICPNCKQQELDID